MDSTIAVTVVDDISHACASVRYCTCIHHAFHKQPGSLLTSCNGGFRQVRLQQLVFATTSTVPWCRRRSGSLSAVVRPNLMTHVMRALSIVNFIGSFRLGSWKWTDLKAACPVLGQQTNVVLGHAWDSTGHSGDQQDCLQNE